MTSLSDGVIALDDATEDQLEIFHHMEKDEDTVHYILPYSVDEHKEEFSRNDVVYKSVYDRHNNLVGFVILILDPDGKSVEFGRIVIAPKGQSYGSRAVSLIERVCKEELNRQRIWLDVFEFNQRAQHVYESSGYRYFGSRQHEGKTLRLYEKDL